MQTWRLIKRLTDLTGCGVVAQMTAKTIGTIEAWGRQPAGHLNPWGTGRNNVLDGALRIIGLAHKEDRALAREMAEIFPDYVDALDGKAHRTSKQPLQNLIGCAVKEHGEAIFACLNEDDPDWHHVFTQIKEAQVEMRKLELFVKDEMASRPLEAVAR